MFFEEIETMSEVPADKADAGTAFRCQGVGLARPGDASAQLLQRSSAAPQQGLRLSELVPQHAARGLTPSFLARPPVPSSGGPGGPTDPWKALAIRWDYGAPMHWPIRVSPWEVISSLRALLYKPS